MKILHRCISCDRAWSGHSLCQNCGCCKECGHDPGCCFYHAPDGADSEYTLAVALRRMISAAKRVTVDDMDPEQRIAADRLKVSIELAEEAMQKAGAKLAVKVVRKHDRKKK